jgi:hypothetical protein
MTRKEMLQALGVTDNELKDLLKKFRAFLKRLDPAQQKVVKRSLPTLAEAVKAFDKNATEAEVRELFGGDARQEPVILCLPCRVQSSRR